MRAGPGIDCRPVTRTLLTGGTGFIGSALAVRLLERGDDLRLTIHSRSADDALRAAGAGRLDFERVPCDIRARRAVRRALAGIDRVFHLAGFVSLRPRDRERL